MKKNVKIFIKGMHAGEDTNSDVGSMMEGTYYYKEDKHYIFYEEKSSDGAEQSNNILKIKKNEVELIRKGYSATHLYFEEGKLNNTYYDTIIGKLFVGVDTKSVHIEETDSSIRVKIEYSLLMDDEKVSDCVVDIEVKEQ